MKTLRDVWSDLRSAFWFPPAVIVLASAALAVALVEAEQVISDEAWSNWPRLFGAGADGSRGMLAAIAGSMITVAGVAFSITIVTLALASSQYTSRVLRNFIRNRTNQIVLGVFVGIFAYCLIVLRTIRGGDEGVFVPGLAVLVAVVLAFAGIGVLIFFIHHIATSIQASYIIADVANETLHAVDHLFPEELGHPAGDEIARPPFDAQPGHVVAVQRTGYIRRVDAEALLRFARTRRAVVRMERSVGEFVIEGTPLVSLFDAESSHTAADARELNDAYTIGMQRSVDQDAGFGIRQLVDVALKGLSPGVNDTTTAVMCVDYLTAILSRLTARQLGTPLRVEDGQLRVVACRPTYADFVATALDQIRQNADGNVVMLERLLQSLETLSGVATTADRRRLLAAHVAAIREVAQRSVPSPTERAELDSLGARLSAAMLRSPSESRSVGVARSQ